MIPKFLVETLVSLVEFVILDPLAALIPSSLVASATTGAATFAGWLQHLPVTGMWLLIATALLASLVVDAVLFTINCYRLVPGKFT